MSGVSVNADPARRGSGRRSGPGQPPYGAGFRAVTAASLLAAYLLVVLGDTVRVTESGMGCASWPLCNGQAGLTGTYHALLEQSHRYLAAVVTVLVLATLAAAWRSARQDRLVHRTAVAAVGLIGVQVVLGAITVFTHNAGWTVALHLAVAWLVVGAVTVTMLGVWRAPAPGNLAAREDLATGALGIQPAPGGGPARAAPAGRLGLAAAVALFALAVSGMLVLHDGASNACPSLPVCGAGTAHVGLVVLQYLHRSLALLATVIVAAAAVRAWRSPTAGRAGRVAAVAVLTLLAGTLAFGAIVATTGAPDAEQALHLAVGSALWIAVVALATPAAPGQAAPAPAEHL